MVGTGSMIGLPGQSLHDLAGDIVFFQELGAESIGKGQGVKGFDVHDHIQGSGLLAGGLYF